MSVNIPTSRTLYLNIPALTDVDSEEQQHDRGTFTMYKKGGNDHVNSIRKQKLFLNRQNIVTDNIITPESFSGRIKNNLGNDKILDI
jgi:hypothetical protein